MFFLCRLFALILFLTCGARAADRAKQLVTVNPLPTALSDDFEFRKTKLYFLSDRVSGVGGVTLKEGQRNRGKVNDVGSGKASADASIAFERQYRLFGAVTRLDQLQRYGNYFDFFWRAKRTADVTVRLEYQQENLHSQLQARELYYPHIQGRVKTEFTIIGDDYLDDGQVIAWRCLLIENGRIVAENRSYLWK